MQPKKLQRIIMQILYGLGTTSAYCPMCPEAIGVESNFELVNQTNGHCRFVKALSYYCSIERWLLIIQHIRLGYLQIYRRRKSHDCL